MGLRSSRVPIHELLYQRFPAALGDNFQLRAGWARLSQAQALAVQAGAPRWPTVDLNISASRQRQVFGAFGVNEFSSFSASVPVSYEIDLFNRIGATAAAADLDARASRDDVEALAISISAEVAEAYFNLVEIRERRAILEGQLGLNETFAELTELLVQLLEVLEIRCDPDTFKAILDHVLDGPSLGDVLQAFGHIEPFTAPLLHELLELLVESHEKGKGTGLVFIDRHSHIEPDRACGQNENENRHEGEIALHLWTPRWILRHYRRGTPIS